MVFADIVGVDSAVLSLHHVQRSAESGNGVLEGLLGIASLMTQVGELALDLQAACAGQALDLVGLSACFAHDQFRFTLGGLSYLGRHTLCREYGVARGRCSLAVFCELGVESAHVLASTLRGPQRQLKVVGGFRQEA